MADDSTRWYVIDIHARSYYGGKAFASRDEALVAARAIPRELRPFGVSVASTGIPGSCETIYPPIQDM